MSFPCINIWVHAVLFCLKTMHLLVVMTHLKLVAPSCLIHLTAYLLAVLAEAVVHRPVEVTMTMYVVMMIIVNNGYSNRHVAVIL